MNFAKQNSKKIRSLALGAIGAEGIERASALASLLKSPKENARQEAVTDLKSLFSNKQKRPLYYLHGELEHELDETRSVVWYASMYIEWLVKFMRAESARKKFPLGVLLHVLRKDIPDEFRNELLLYNEIFWATSKHEVGGYPDDEHLFSLEDAVLCCLITANLANRIMSISQRARDYSEGKILI